MKITNISKGPRGVNSVNGPVLVDPRETVEVDVYAREQQHLEGAGWFDIDGDYTDDPVAAGAAALAAASVDVASELEALKAQLAERDAELAKLKGDGLDREELKKQAEELGIEYARNVPVAKLKEMIDAKLAS